MILRTVKLYIADLQYSIGCKLRNLGNKLTRKGEKTRLDIEMKEALEHFKAFKDISNKGKEYITIIEDDDLGPIYKN